MAAYGVHAYEEARRRRFQAGSVTTARFWLRVKAEIGRRLVDGCGDASHFDRLEAKLSSFDPMSGARSGWDDTAPAEDWDRRRAHDAERPALADAPRIAGVVAPAEPRTVRAQAEADMRAAMKRGDLDGVRSALRRMEPSVLALN